MVANMLAILAIDHAALALKFEFVAVPRGTSTNWFNQLENPSSRSAIKYLDCNEDTRI